MQSAEAEARGFPHGVSVVSFTQRQDASVASRREVELYFTVTKTGRSAYHFTVVLPRPVGNETAAVFNRLFGRGE